MKTNLNQSIMDGSDVKVSPSEVLEEKSDSWHLPIDSMDFAKKLDNEDPLSSFRQLFSFPQKREHNCAHSVNTDAGKFVSFKLFHQTDFQ
jgi:hypothetical protein